MPTSLLEKCFTLAVIALLAAVLLFLCAATAQAAMGDPRPALRTGPTVYVAPTGNDATACSAVSQASPRRTINGGLACLAPGGTLAMADGTYDELLVGQVDQTTTCQSTLAQVQQPCQAIPNGPDADHPTRLVATASGVLLSPRGKEFPGGGGIITLFQASRHLVFEGLRLVTHPEAGSAQGFAGGEAQHVTFTRGELDRGSFKSGVASQYFRVTHSHLHHAGAGCVPPGEKPTPQACQHGLYMCGQHHAITDNTVEYSGYYNVQVSCEQGGIADIRIERNRVRYGAVVGIRCAGDGCLVASNLLVGNGQGISVSGHGTVAHNTLAGYTPQPYNGDPWGVYYSGTYQIVDNILTGQQSAFYAIGNDRFTPPDPAQVHHNLCDLTSNTGCTLIGSAEAVYTHAAQEDYTLKRTATNPALGAGVPVSDVEADVQGRPFHRTHPSLGAYALDLAAPVPPQPPAGQGPLVCTGTVQAVPGAVQMTCTPQEGRR